MVAAGVFLVARFFPVFEASTAAMNTVAYVGAGTALFAATMGLVMTDIKRVLAYSTVSQLGFMMFALGVRGCAGCYFPSVHPCFLQGVAVPRRREASTTRPGHTTSEGWAGFAKTMPWTFSTFTIGGLAIAGIPPFSGFWSKDEILAAAWHYEKGVYILGILAAFLTSIYIFRLIFITFLGSYRGGEEPQHGEHVPDEPEESPKVMVIPMVILAAGAFAAGLANLPEFSILGIPKSWISDLLTGHGEPFPDGYCSIIFDHCRSGNYHLPTPSTFGELSSPKPSPTPSSRYTNSWFANTTWTKSTMTGIVRKAGMGNRAARGGDLFDRDVVDRIVNWVGGPGSAFRRRDCQAADGAGAGLRGRDLCRADSDHGRVLVRNGAIEHCTPGYSA